MQYKHHYFKLSSGHTIITPQGKPITENEFKEYFSIVSDWLKQVRPNAFDEINPVADNNESYATMLNNMFNAYLYDPVEGGIQEKYFLDKRTLAFIFVTSYFIQKENKENINQLLSHVMAHSLLQWLPHHNLIEHYLSISAKEGEHCDLSDAFLLVRLYCPNIGFHNYGFPNDINKALDYATLLYNNPLNKHKVDNYDYAYVRALFEKDRKNAAKCIEIIDKKLNKYNIEYENHTNVLLNYLILELEIASKEKVLSINLDMNYIEDFLDEQSDYSARKNQGYYWLAQCYINGKNNNKNVDKAISLLTKIKDPYLYKKAGAAFAKLFLEGNGVDLDAREAYDIAEMADSQANIHGYIRDKTNKEIDEVMYQAHLKMIQENYINFLSYVLDKPIHYVNEENIDFVLKFHLSDEDFNYLKDGYSADDEYETKRKEIIRKLRHPVVRKELLEACNQMIYVGTDKSGYENYLNFEECGNMFIHGTCGAGKTWYLYSIFKRLKQKETANKVNICFWSFKPFEFEGWCDDYLVKNPHEFIEKISKYKKNSDAHSVIFIDEFSDFMFELTDKEKEMLINLFKESESNNMTFISCSQNMTSALDEFGEYVKTRVCMLCSRANESKLMIGSEAALSIKSYGKLYIANNSVPGYMRPKSMKVVKP